jgi:WS/DGAT/MGAT family acyltransferase
MRLSDLLDVGIAQVNPRDAEFIYYEADGHPNHLVAVYFFETSKHPDSEFTQTQAVEWVAARLGHHRMFTHRVQRTPLGLGHPYWVYDPDLDVRDHVQVTAITEPGWAPFQNQLSALLTSHMDLNRPPWELHFFTGIEGLDAIPGRLTAVVLKSHHSGADGIAIRMLGDAIFSDALQPRKSATAVPLLRARLFTRSVLNFPGELIQFAKSIPRNRAAVRAVDEAKAAGEWAESLYESAGIRFNGKVSAFALVEPITLSGAEVREVKNAVPGATVNDVLLAVVGCALARYLAEKGEERQASLFAMVPRSMRKQEEWESANQLVSLSVDMHTKVEDPLERLALIAESARSEKARTSHIAVRRMSTAVETLPAPIMRLLAYSRRLYDYNLDRPRYQHTMVSNIPLSVEGLTLNGAPGAAVLANQAPVHGDGLRHFLVASSGGGLTLNVIVDAVMMPDLDHYLELLRASFEELKEAASTRELENDSAEIAS